MRISTWNCQGALHRKLDVVEAIGADVQIIQECAEDAAIPGFQGLWYPPYPGAPKGTGVFVRNGWSVEWTDDQRGLPWVRSVTLSNTGTGVVFALLAVWTNVTKTEVRPNYAGQFAAVLDAYAEDIKRGKCIVAGDLNASRQGPSRTAHRANLETAASLGLVSAYHHANEAGDEDEADMTLKWIGPGKKEYLYHCDFIFVSSDLASGLQCSVLNTFEWPRRVSDHQPVLADLQVG